MKFNERTYRYSSHIRVLSVLALPLFGFMFVFFLSQYRNEYEYWFIIIILTLVAVYSLYRFSSKVIVSSDEITVLRFSYSKSLRWDEIHQVDRSNGIKLRSETQDVSLAIDSQLEGYLELLEIIKEKKPKLFQSEETEFTRSMRSHLTGLIFLVTAIIGGVWMMEQRNDICSGVLFIGLGLSMLGLWLAPLKISLQNNGDLMVTYLLGKRTIEANDITSIKFEKVRMRRTYYYPVNIFLASGKKISIYGFNQDNSIIYEAIRKWHNKVT